MTLAPFLPIVIVGTLRQDYLIAPGGKSLDNIPGGHLFHTAIHAHHWEQQIGLISRVSPSYPIDWLEKLSAIGIDTRGIKRTVLPIDHRFFIHYDLDYQKSTIHPMAQYANEGLPFPKDLLGYNQPIQIIDSESEKTSETIIARDVPSAYLETPFIHMCPMDFMTHNLLTQHFTQFGQKRITLRAGSGYMVPQFLQSMPSLLNPVTAFIATDHNLKSLFAEQRREDLWEMAKTLADWGPDYVLILQDNQCFLLWDNRAGTGYRVEPYQTKVVNPTGINDAFCGGFIGCLQKTYDPLQALTAGVVAASFAVEANQPYYALDVIPGLHDARAHSIQNQIEVVR
jgi:sugar/nucleoside kinase (ribokinase family)